MMRALRIFSLLAAALTLAACAVRQSANGIGGLPTLAQIRSRIPRHYLPPRDVRLPQPTAILTMQSLDLPLTADTADIWNLVDETAIPARTRRAWNANGLRIGFISRGKLRKLQQVLPPVLAVGRARFTSSDQLAPLMRSPPLDEALTVRLPTRGSILRTIHIIGGRAQLLASVQQDAAHNLYLDLVPHHYVPRITIRPESLLEKPLDGRIFRSLTLRTEMPPGALIVLGLYRPQPDKNKTQQNHPDNHPGDQSAGPTPGHSPRLPLENLITPPKHGKTATTPGTTPRTTPGKHPSATTGRVEKQPPGIPHRFGFALMLSPRYDRLAQRLILLSVRRLPGAGISQSAHASPSAHALTN